MMNPLKLADQAETCANLVRDRGVDDLAFVQLVLSEQEARLLAAALRLAEARFALDAHEDDEPTEGLIGEWTAWSEERGVLHLRVVDAAVNYELARKATVK
jgi:hypothetical protein